MNLSIRLIFRITLVTGFAFLSTSKILAQTKVSGIVTSGKHEAVKNVTIRFKDGKDVLNTSSDTSGRFHLILPKSGNYLMTISAIGYLPYYKEYPITGTVELVLNEIILTNSNEELQAVEIVGATTKKYFSDYSFSATKTATLNKDIPQSISTISKGLITDRQAGTLADAVKNVAGVSQSSFYNQFAIRGINQNQEGAIINGMRTHQFFFNQPLTSNLERIEVIKGPASATFSSADPGGSINMVTKKPLAEDRKQISTTIGNFSSTRTALDFTGPLNKEKTLLYRLNAACEDSKSFRDLQYKKAYLISPSLSYIPDDKTSMNVELVFNNSKSRLDRGQPIFGAIAGKTNLNSTPITFNMGSTNDSYVNQDLMVMSNFSQAITPDIIFNTAFMTQTWTEDLQEHRTTNAFAVDGNNIEIPTLAAMRAVQRKQKWNTNNQSFYFSINASTGALKHKIVVGYDVMRTKKNGGGSENSAQGYRLKDGTIAPKYDPAKKDLYLFKTVNGINAPVPNVEHFNLANPLNIIHDLSDYIFTKTEIPPAYSIVNGIYVQDQVKYQNLVVTLGLRQEWYRDYSNYGQNTEKKTSRKKLLPRLGITYAITPGIKVYGTYLQGYQPQENTSIIIMPPAGTNYKPLESDLKEIGVKSEWFGRTLMVNASLFEINQRNLLLNANDPVDVNLLIERGAQRSRGLEIEASGFILPNWQFNAGYCYTDAIVKQDNDATMIGQRVQNTPKHSGSIWTRYDLQDSKLFNGIGFGAGVQYSGDKLPLYIRNFTLPAYTIVDAAIYYAPAKTKVQLAINVNNVFNRAYWVGAQNYLRLFPGTPRNIMFNVTYSF